MSRYDDILKTEYSEKFDTLRKNRMVTSFDKYGPLQVNYENKLIDGIKTLEECIQKYKKTGNTEYLVDVSNYAMIEFMYPQHEKAYFKSTELKDSAGIVGISVKQLENF